MTILWIITICISVIYLLLIWSLLIGWLKTRDYPVASELPAVKVSVIIPVRNEENNIKNLLEDLILQKYANDKMEIIVVDDHSEDQTVNQVVEVKSRKVISLVLLQSPGKGKKAALYRGIMAAKNNMILTLDADCRVGDRWLLTMTDAFLNLSADMLFGPVLYTDEKGLFEQLQSLEFLSLIGAGAGTSGMGMPILCNSANLMFRKNQYLEYYNTVNQNIPSGDDILFLLWLRKKQYKIRFLKSKFAVVNTIPSGTLRDFVNQRIRWTSKNRFYKDFGIIITAVLIYTVNLFLFFLLAGTMMDKDLIYLFLFLIGVKTAVDFLFLVTITGFFNKFYLMRLFIPLEFLYIFYVSVIGFAGNFLSFSWKGRNY